MDYLHCSKMTISFSLINKIELTIYWKWIGYYEIITHPGYYLWIIIYPKINSHVTSLFSFCSHPCSLLFVPCPRRLSLQTFPLSLLTLWLLFRFWKWDPWQENGIGGEKSQGTYFFYSPSANPQFCQRLLSSACSPSLHHGGSPIDLLSYLCFLSHRALTDSQWSSLWMYHLLNSSTSSSLKQSLHWTPRVCLLSPARSLMGKILILSLTMSLTIITTTSSGKLGLVLWALGIQISLMLGLNLQIPPPFYHIFLQRNSIDRIPKKLAFTIIRTAGPKSRASWQPRDSVKSVYFSLESDGPKLRQNVYIAIQRQNCFLFGEP